jgi:hypothetical protein
MSGTVGPIEVRACNEGSGEGVSHEVKENG